MLPVVALSYWRVEYSRYGHGRSLFFQNNSANAPVKSCYSDNPELAVWLDNNFNRHFDGFDSISKVHGSFQDAHISERSNDSEFELRIESHSVQIVAKWSDFGNAEQIINSLTGFGLHGSDEFSVSAVIIPARCANINGNGIEAIGAIKDSYGILSSSAFLATAESWASTEQ